MVAVCSDAPMAGLDAQRSYERSSFVKPGNSSVVANMTESLCQRACGAIYLILCWERVRKL